MCGIVAFWKCGNDRTLGRALDVIRHRGPDDEGRFEYQGSFLGVRRLSIIDVDGGHQPAFNGDRTVTVVLNGEIYNHGELREELLRLGCKFVSGSDTEVLAHGISEWGIEPLLNKCRGMFSFAALDQRSQKMFVARDRLGIKPLYWTKAGNGYAFASEVKSLFMLEDVAPNINVDKVPEQIANRFVSGEDTIFSGIHRVAPGTYLTLNEQTDPVPNRFWEIPTATDFSPDLQEITDTVRDLVADGVRDRLVSDVPVGALLSGGLDSSIVVAQMSELSGTPPFTFTVGFGNASLDERPFAQIVAREFGTQHYEEELAVSDAGSLEEVVWHFDEPVGDAAALPTLLIARTAAKHVKVVLTGEGSDELFGGYPRYRLSQLADRLHRFPNLLWKPFLDPLQLLPGMAGHIAGRLFSSQGETQLRNAMWMSGLSPDSLGKLIPGQPAGAWKKAYSDGHEAKPWRLDMSRWLLNDILVKVDKMSMGASLEARVPFLDHRLVEYMSRLSDQVRGKWLGKTILKKAFENALPASVFARKKAPFKPPVREWFRGETGKKLEALFAEKNSLLMVLGNSTVTY
jgi:asparagine synthase (glutamine-hydrolysing)